MVSLHIVLLCRTCHQVLLPDKAAAKGAFTFGKGAKGPFDKGAFAKGAFTFHDKAAAAAMYDKTRNRCIEKCPAVS